MQRYWKILLGFWVVAIWVGSLIPLNQPVTPGGDKMQHMLGYAGLSFLAARLFGARPSVWIAASVMGVLVECAQYFTPWRSFDVMDMLANGLGGLIGLLAALLWQVFFNRRAA